MTINIPYKKIHFIGIGGIGMSALALAMHKGGYLVSGSDLSDSGIVQMLKKEGISVLKSHSSKAIEGKDLVVYSTAISEENPERKEAKRMNIPCWHRSGLLGQWMGQAEQSMGITGTHGKTSTTALLTQILESDGSDPTAFIGGIAPQWGGNLRLGRIKRVVAELDESDRSMCQISVQQIIVTNLEDEHREHYKNLEDLLDTLEGFLFQQKDLRVLFLSADSFGTLRLYDRCKTLNPITFGKSRTADYHLEDFTLTRGGSQFSVSYKGKSLGLFSLPVPGECYMYNALAALACAHQMGIEISLIQKAFHKRTRHP